MATLGISLIVHNEAQILPEALASARFADDLVVVDCTSSDESAAVASRCGARVFSRPNNPNLNVNKSFGFAQLQTDWIFYLDPDERIPGDLAAEIRAMIDGPDGERFRAFRLPRRNHFFGRPLLHGGQYPDRQLRLFRRGFASFPNRHVHESLDVQGEIGNLRQAFDHFPYPTLSVFLRKMDFYTSFQADFWRQEGRRPSLFDDVRFFIARPATRFLRRYFLKQGFRDGWQGFVACLGDSFGIAMSWAKLREASAGSAFPPSAPNA